MATYLKRTSKMFSPRPPAEVSLRELMCPVCHGILIEPVTLPCSHNLCLSCLRGTFEHNSLSCPLCRIRVGSWLRAASRSESLVNNGLWELIRGKYRKEVEDKHNGRDIELEAGLVTANKILSAAGEIRREYEVQVQLAEEEMRRRREAEEMASQALIRKIQMEEQRQQLAQLAQDQLLAKTLARRQVAEKQKGMAVCYAECLNSSFSNCSLDTSKAVLVSNMESTSMEDAGRMDVSELKDSSEFRRSNMTLLSKIRAERYASSVKESVYKDSAKFCCQKPVPPVYNTVPRVLKQQVGGKFAQPSVSSFVPEPSCSTSKIYGTQTKEELRVPSDVVNSKKKSLDVEVCMTSAEDDERTGSAESAGSHDSINQEIHHFKPIKAVPRTPLKLSIDGKQIDPKLIRVVPILKRISNAMPKPPSPTHLKRVIGCSWSAFRGRARQDSKSKEDFSCSSEEAQSEPEQKASTSFTQSQSNPGKTRSQTHDTIRRLEFIPEVSFDTNRNHAKNVNRIINGTKVSKKLSLDEHVDSGRIHKSWRVPVRNGLIGKSKRQKNLWFGKKDTKDTDNDSRDSDSSFISTKATPEEEQQEDCMDETTTLENIAERIKKRKSCERRLPYRTTAVLQDAKSDPKAEGTRRNTRKRISAQGETENPLSGQVPLTVQKGTTKVAGAKTASKAKRQRICRTTQMEIEDSEENDSSVNTFSENSENVDSRISTRSFKSSRRTDGSGSSSCRSNYRSKAESKYESCEETQDSSSANNSNDLGRGEKTVTDEDVIKEQERIERLVLQEKEDFELAQRLQAKFDEMERIAGRMTRSRKAIESVNLTVDFYEIDVSRTLEKSTGENTATQSTVVDTIANNETKKRRGRSRKRVK